jgi:hypothetical protein
MSGGPERRHSQEPVERAGPSSLEGIWTDWGLQKAGTLEAALNDEVERTGQQMAELQATATRIAKLGRSSDLFVRQEGSRAGTKHSLLESGLRREDALASCATGLQRPLCPQKGNSQPNVKTDAMGQRRPLSRP